jgi:hypothetical protein
MIKVGSLYTEQLAPYKEFLQDVSQKIENGNGVEGISIPATEDQYKAILENKKYSDMVINWDGSLVKINWSV